MHPATRDTVLIVDSRPGDYAPLLEHAAGAGLDLAFCHTGESALDRRWSQVLGDLDLWLVWAGRGAMPLAEGQRVELRPGVVLWMRPNRLYLAEQDVSNRLGVTFIHFDLVDDRTGKRPVDLPGELHELVDVPYGDAVARRVVELLRAAGGQTEGAAAHEAARTLLRGLLMDLDGGAGRRDAAEAAGTAGHHRALVMQVAARIQESPGEAVSVADLARAVGYSPDHFTRIFRQVLGQSPQAYIVQERIHRARQLLTESSLTVTQIAAALGYESVYFFSRQFKQKTGVSPSQYRQSGAG